MNKLLTIVVAIFAMFALTAPVMADDEVVSHADITMGDNSIVANGNSATDHTSIDVDITAYDGIVDLTVGSSVTENTMLSYAAADVTTLSATLDTDVDANGYDVDVYTDLNAVLTNGHMDFDATAIHGDIEFTNGNTENGLYALASVEATADQLTGYAEADVIVDEEEYDEEEISVSTNVVADTLNGVLEAIGQVIFGNNED